MGSLSLLPGIFPTRGLNPGLPHCRWILYQLSHKGSPRILEWVAYPFSSTSSWLRNQTGVSCIAGRFFTNWAIREALKNKTTQQNRKRGELPQHDKKYIYLLETYNLYHTYWCKTKIFPLRGTKEVYSLLPLLSNIILEVLTNAIRQ